MSMNLHCNLIQLTQTPTFVTEMCMVQANGEIPFQLKGKKAKHALQIYKKWVNSWKNGKWENPDLEEMCLRIENHLKDIVKVEGKRGLVVEIT